MNHTTKNNIRGSAIVTILGGVVILLAVLFFLVKLATSGAYSNVEQSTDSATETRIMPVGNVTMGDGTPIGQRTGDQIFNKICIQCHAVDSLVPNSPKITNNAEWAPRIAQGFETLFTKASTGFNAMPAKGGAADLTDDELKRAIAHMVNQSGGNMPVPAVGAEGEAASGVAASDTASAPAAGEQSASLGGDGKKTFDALCFACHSATSVIPFSPKVTHNADWTARIAQGKNLLFKHAIEGYTGPDGGVMPAKGGNSALSDDEVKAAVVYMVKQSGGKF